MIKLASALLMTFLLDSPDSLEQKACDYFFDHVFEQNYNDYKVIEFKNQTDTSRYWDIVHQCKNWDQKTRGQIIFTKPSESVYVKVNTSTIRIKKSQKNSSRLKVFIYSTIKVGNSYYVSIAVYKKLHFTDYYFIKFDEDGDIVDTCKTGEII